MCTTKPYSSGDCIYVAFTHAEHSQSSLQLCWENEDSIWGCSSVVEHSPGVHESLGSTPAPQSVQEKMRRTEVERAKLWRWGGEVSGSLKQCSALLFHLLLRTMQSMIWLCQETKVPTTLHKSSLLSQHVSHHKMRVPGCTTPVLFVFIKECSREDSILHRCFGYFANNLLQFYLI